MLPVLSNRLNTDRNCLQNIFTGYQRLLEVNLY